MTFFHNIIQVMGGVGGGGEVYLMPLPVPTITIVIGIECIKLFLHNSNSA